MDVVDITEENIEDLMDLVDVDVADNIGRRYFHGKVLVNGEGESVGVLIWEYKNLDEYSDNEAELSCVSLVGDTNGKELFDAYKTEVDSENVVKSFFELEDPDENVYESIVDQDFKTRKQESRDVYVPLEKLAAHKVSIGRVPNYVVALKDISSRDFKQGIIGCLYRGRKGILEDIAVLPKEWYEKELSCVVRTDDDLTGFLLIRRLPSGSLMPVLFYAVGPNYKMDLVNMLRYSIQKATESYESDTKILIRRHTEAVKALVGKLFPELQGEEILAGIRKE